MPQCECGCGKQAVKKFRPGHDLILRISLEKSVGGLLSLRALVQAAKSYAEGKESEQSFLKRVRAIFTQAYNLETHRRL